MADITGTNSPDLLLGLLGDDNLYGLGGTDVIAGLTGNDRIEGGADGDVIIGGTLNILGGVGNVVEDVLGEDVAVYENSNAGVTVNLAQLQAVNITLPVLLGGLADLSLSLDNASLGSGGHAEGDVLVGIKSLIGSAFDDVLTLGNTRDGNFAEGLGGDDALTGSSTDDLLDGGAGEDTLAGGDGDDLLIGGAGGDVIDGGDGFDTVSYAGATNRINVDISSGGAGVSPLDDATGDSFTSIEAIIGSAYGDRIAGGTQSDRLDGADGDDEIEGGDGNDTIIGGAGDDLLAGGAGADTISGGDGNDTINYAPATTGVTVNLETGATSDGDVFDDIENVRGSAFNDSIYGDVGSNVLSGGDGNDVLRGRGGADVIDGGAGTDAASYFDSIGAVEVQIGKGIATGSEAQGDSLISIENLSGSAFDDVLGGTTGVINTIAGRGGNDLLMSTGDADIFDGGDGTDTLSYADVGTGVTVSLASGTSSLGESITGVENLTGTTYGDRLTGGSTTNILTGGSGDDVLEGGAGADSLQGGAGNDAASYLGSAAAVTVSLATGTASGGDAAGDSFSSIENLSGSVFADTLTGSATANAIRGNGGNDVITGGGGADLLEGNGGADRFVYLSAADSGVFTSQRDTIIDFSAAQGDLIDLSAIDARTDLSGDQAFTFLGTGAYTGAGGEVRITVQSSSLLVSGDIDGDGTSEFFITLTGTTTPLDASDFLL
ncbi:calcium-binding protein [Tistrella mobilis]